jgi:hypothetical protein
MRLFTWLNSRIQRYHWYDISLIKVSAAACVLLLAKFWPPLLSLEWHWYAAIAVIAALPPLKKLFSNTSKPTNKEIHHAS